MKEGLQTFSLDEVKQHNKDGDMWIILSSKVYNVSNWIRRHPGGELAIKNFAGMDCTEQFVTFHNQEQVDKILPTFLVGTLKSANARGVNHEEKSLAKDIDSLREELIQMGVFDPDYFYYFKKFAFLGFLLALTISIVLSASSHLMVIVAALLMGFFWQQTAFVGHDVGHHSLSKSASIDDKIGLVVGNLLTGVSIGWWQDSHNTHHLVTNSVEYDPDIQHLPVFAVTRDYFKNVFSKYHNRVLPFDSISKFFVSYQHYLYYPIMGIARINLYAQSLIYVLLKSKKSYNWRRNELIALFVFWTWYMLLCSCLPTWLDVALFFWISHGFAGILHVQITLSHFSMPTYHGLPQEQHDEDGYVKTQFQTTMNIDCYPFMDFFHGGLQFQVEHHIFPFATRNKFRLIRPKMKEICKRHGLPYHEKSFFDANVHVLKTLKETAEHARVFSTMFVDGLNARGNDMEVTGYLTRKAKKKPSFSPRYINFAENRKIVWKETTTEERYR